MQSKWVARYGACAALLGLAAACGSPPPIKKETAAERIQREHAVNAELTRQFESKMKLREDTEVAVYLRKLAQSLEESNPSLKSSSIGVQMVRDRGGIWRDYGLPGNRIYLSVGLLRHLEFENELAAAIALELGHLRGRHALERLSQASEPGAPGASGGSNADYPTIESLLHGQSGDAPREVEFFGPGGILSFSQKAQIQAVEKAVDILYRAGYDPRGIISLLERYEAHPEHSPYDEGTISKMTEQARRVIALYSPLRNPIVRSVGFLAVQKRIQKL